MNILSMITGGKKTNPFAAMNALLEQAEKRAGKPINHLIMEVDFKAEDIVFKLPEYKIMERVKDGFMFMLISTALRTQFSEEIKDVDVVALDVDYKKDTSMDCTYFYIDGNGKKLFDKKQIKN